MRRIWYVVLGIFAAASIATACGSSFKPAESTVYVTDQGTVISADIEDFNEDYYDEEELNDYITESVESYVADNGDGSVEIDSFKIESSNDAGSRARLNLTYASYIDYAQFNDVMMFAGTVSEAQQEQYELGQNFQKVEKEALAGSMDISEILDEEEWKIVIIRENTNVKVDGTVRYVSDGNAQPVGRDTVQVSYDTEDADARPAVIIYK